MACKKSSHSKVSNCLRSFLAHLFSHVGLCGLVVGYSILGALMFEYLEGDYEGEVREMVEEERTKALADMYTITGK